MTDSSRTYLVVSEAENDRWLGRIERFTSYTEARAAAARRAADAAESLVVVVYEIHQVAGFIGRLVAGEGIEPPASPV